MKTPSLNRILFLISVLICCEAVTVGATLQAKVTEVQSGNTLVVSNINRPLKVRLKGIAPPEAGQPFSDVAREHLKALVFDKAVFVEYTNLAEGYLEAKVLLNGIDVGSQMLRDGVAWYDHTVNYGLSDSDKDLYARCEQAARAEKRGLWAHSNPVAPWEFRRAQQEQEVKLQREETARAATTRSASTRPSKRSFSNADMFGNLFGGTSSGDAPVRRVSENGTPDRWMTIDSPTEHFSISVPSNSIEGSFAGADPQGQPTSFHFLTGGSYEAFFIFLSAKGPQLTLSDSTVADQTINSMIAGMNQGASAHRESARILTIKSGRPVTIGAVSGKEYRLHSQEFEGNARVLTRKIGEAQEVFMMLTLTRAGSETLGTRFINSFKLH